MKAAIPPGFEETWAKVLISVHDLSERMRATFLKDMFGRYLSEEVTNTLLENPDMINLGGEKRSVTIMMSDLRGFTALAERLEPEQVVQMLNNYFEIMVEVLLKYNGTINEIIGDALLVIFGAQAVCGRKCLTSVNVNHFRKLVAKGNSLKVVWFEDPLKGPLGPMWLISGRSPGL